MHNFVVLTLENTKMTKQLFDFFLHNVIMGLCTDIA